MLIYLDGHLDGVTTDGILNQILMDSSDYFS